MDWSFHHNESIHPVSYLFCKTQTAKGKQAYKGEVGKLCGTECKKSSNITQKRGGANQRPTARSSSDHGCSALDDVEDNISMLYVCQVQDISLHQAGDFQSQLKSIGNVTHGK